MHPGGPYWKCKNFWTISKGEMKSNEKIIDTASREFKEETSFDAPTSSKFLGTYKVNNKKLVTMFYGLKDIDTNKCFSNTFQMEFPKHSNKFITVHEMDSYKWFNIKDAKKVIMKSQIYFLNKLEEKVKDSDTNDNTSC